MKVCTCKNIRVAPMINFELLAKHAGSPMDSHDTFPALLPLATSVGNQADTITTGIGLHRGSNLN